MKPMRERHFAILRRHMVDVIAIHVDLLSDELGKAALHERVFAAMQRVPRHLFVPEQFAPLAYQDSPLPIGFDKTISQPFINALMTDLLSLNHDDAVLEIGTGLGYQAALLAELADHVWTVEIVEEFASQAELLLHRLGYFGITIRVGDGSRGWAEHAPYDKIIVTAAARQPPPALLDQLKPAGRLVLPVGDDEVQQLTVVDKDINGSIRTRAVIPVRFSRLETII
jgi:protein-L-isoaspartate(D-aspartate) O-methyltransferase